MSRTKSITDSQRKKKYNESRHVEEGAGRSGLESLKKWMEFYCNNSFPMIICCGKCGKWRKTSEYEEKWDVPESWNCSMWNTSDGQRGNCKMPSDVNEEDYVDEDYTPGSLVWAKMTGYPEWPAMIEDDPILEDYCKDLETKAKYHVVFLGDPPSRRWISGKQLKPFKMPSADGGRIKSSKGIRLGRALKEAEKAIKMTKSNRLMEFSFGARFKKEKNTGGKAVPVKVNKDIRKTALRNIAARPMEVKRDLKKRALQNIPATPMKVKRDLKKRALQNIPEETVYLKKVFRNINVMENADLTVEEREEIRLENIAQEVVVIKKEIIDPDVTGFEISYIQSESEKYYEEFLRKKCPPPF